MFTFKFAESSIQYFKAQKEKERSFVYLILHQNFQHCNCKLANFLSISKWLKFKRVSAISIKQAETRFRKWHRYTKHKFCIQNRHLNLKIHYDYGQLVNYGNFDVPKLVSLENNIAFVQKNWKFGNVSNESCP